MRKQAPRKNKIPTERSIALVALSVIAVFVLVMFGSLLYSCGRDSVRVPESTPSSSSDAVVTTTTSATTTTESTIVPTDTPTPVPTETPTPVPTDTPTPVPTETPTPTPVPTETPTPTPVPTDTPTPTPKPTKKNTPTPEPPPPTSTPTPTPLPPPPPPPETTPEPTPSDPPGRDLKAEQQAGVEHAKALGYTITKVYDNSEYAFEFTNATGTYRGGAHVRSGSVWYVTYAPIDRGDPNATYRYGGSGNSVIDLLNSLDPAWMSYGG